MDDKNFLINYHHDKASDFALKRVEELARGILQQNKNLKEFVMGMGTYFFTDRKGENVDTYDSVYGNGGYTSEHSEPCFEELNEFMEEWDDIYKMTGEAMRFTAKGKKITKW